MLLYIGATKHGEKRAHQHEKKSPWWMFVDHSRTVTETFDTADEAADRERSLIADLHPPFNRAPGGYPRRSAKHTPVPGAYTAIDQLIILRLAWDSRADLIRAARAEGVTWERIVEAIGLSRATVFALAKQKKT